MVLAEKLKRVVGHN